jgi:hypothetical protein
LKEEQVHYQISLDLEVSIVFINGSLNLQNSQNKTLDVMMSCTTILPDTEVGVFRLYEAATYDKFYARVYGETESRISLDVMLDVEIEHHIISISNHTESDKAVLQLVPGTTMMHVSPVYIRYVVATFCEGV